MSLPPFWALNMVVPLLSMQGQKAIGFHQKYHNLYSKLWTKVLQVWNDMSVSNYWQNFIFGWTIPLKMNQIWMRDSWLFFCSQKWNCSQMNQTDLVLEFNSLTQSRWVNYSLGHYMLRNSRTTSKLCPHQLDSDKLVFYYAFQLYNNLITKLHVFLLSHTHKI